MVQIFLLCTCSHHTKLDYKYQIFTELDGEHVKLAAKCVSEGGVSLSDC